ncbi:L-threonylcarbamoyladenylate synthase [Silvibacterium acidisoli]|uniref:L-threonylcarbamoyladenylate synthase n=1 Tax=Acidobacteriaceae bacterium ZG23-2 TaxID=2883246 RepID=UPI00406C3B12
MKTLRLKTDAAAITEAAQILRSGGTVAFPTETVYGLGANALDAEAVAKIFAAKQRPRWDPLIVHVAGPEMGREMLADLVAQIPAVAAKLMDAFWPGPLTLLMPRTAKVPDAVTAGRPLVGVRMPAHPVAAALIRETGLPIAAPSANTFGHISPTEAAHVIEDLDGRIDAIVDGGATSHGLESTVVGIEGDRCILYRPGVVTLEQIRKISPQAEAYREEKLEAEPEALPSPGIGIRHYAPRARVMLVDGTGLVQRMAFGRLALEVAKERVKLGLLLPDAFAESVVGIEATVFPWGNWSRPEDLAQKLFAGLRWLDAQGVTTILCPLPRDEGVGIAIRDRLRKAAIAV